MSGEIRSSKGSLIYSMRNHSVFNTRFARVRRIDLCAAEVFASNFLWFKAGIADKKMYL